MKLITGITALLALLLLTAAAENKEKEPDPTFRPGADVLIELTVKAPRDWQLNHLLPIQVLFDEKQLKAAPFAVDESTISFKLEDYTEQAVLSIPVRLKDSAKSGELTVPFALDYSICQAESGDCTFNVQQMEVLVTVELSAPKDSKLRALTSGSLQAKVQLPPVAS
ncbi:MAG TPA: hypothetical protein ENO21_03435 [Firmicutes bacterium]|nr:hypothetical protein [Bacillota bacterium]